MRAQVIAGRIGATISALALVGAVGWLTVTDPQLDAGGAINTDQQVQLPPAAAVVVCTAGLHSASEASGDEEFGNKPAATHTLTTAVALAPGGAQLRGNYRRAGGEETFPLPKAGSAASVYRSENETAPGIITVEPNSSEVPAQVASTVSINAAGDLRGLSAATCAPPSAEAWLVGGKTTLGAEATLQVTNPGQTAAQVAISVLSERGPVTATPTTRTIAAGQSEAIQLGGIATNVERLAVQLSATGGQVVAALQHHELDGITPRGSGLVATNAPAARTQYVPGVWLEDDGEAAVRLVNPNEETLTASISVLGRDGEQPLAGASDITIDAQAVQDISLTGLPAGSYTVKITGSKPLLGAVRVTTASTSEASATAWTPAQSPADDLLVPIVDDHDLAVAAQVTNTGDAPVSVAVSEIDSAGALVGERSLDLAAHSSSEVPTASGTKALQLHAPGILAAAQLTYPGADGELKATLGAREMVPGVRRVTVELGGFAR